MLKLQERKLTTQKGIDELRDFLGSFNFESDIKVIKSDISFFARLDVNPSGQKYCYRNCSCKFLWKNGSLLIQAEDDYDFNELDYTVAIKRISFLDCISSFTDLVQKYNQAVVEKEEQIEKFLNFIESWEKEIK